jgi:DNA-binding HxlR family transcriptional regulator
VKRTDRNPQCAVNVAVETVGDPWSLLVVRDVVFYGKRTFGEFLASQERITTSVLADRLTTLVQQGILAKTRSPADKRRECYSLTEKGLALIPVLVELATWGATHGPEVTTNPLWITKARADPVGLRQLVRETILRGGAVFRGQDSVIAQLETDADAQERGPTRQRQLASETDLPSA